MCDHFMIGALSKVSSPFPQRDNPTEADIVSLGTWTSGVMTRFKLKKDFFTNSVLLLIHKAKGRLLFLVALWIYGTLQTIV